MTQLNRQKIVVPYDFSDEALAAMESGDHATAKTKLDQLLLAAPEPPRVNDVAGAYATLSAELEDLSLLRRAVWLAPDHPDQSRWRGRLELAEAEADRERGFIDPDAYREALRLDPSDSTRDAVADVLGDDEAEELAPDVEESSSGILLLAFLLISICALAGAYRAGWLKVPRRARIFLTMLRNRATPSKREPTPRARSLDPSLVFGSSSDTAAPNTEPEARAPSEPVAPKPDTAALVFGFTSADTTIKQQPIEDASATLEQMPISEPVTDDEPDTEPGAEPVLAGLMFAAPDKVETLPGAPAPE